jgi:type IV pilus assembly protein PilW
MKKVNFRRCAGFSLIEIMLALVLGSFVVGGVLSIFVFSKRSYNVNELNARLQENGRAALSTLKDDLRHANFWGSLLRVSEIATFPALGGTCAAWASSVDDRFVGSDDPRTDSPFADEGCLETSDVKDGTSAVAIKRVSLSSVAYDTDLDTGDIFLRTHSASGAMLEKGVTASAAPVAGSGLADWLYEPRIYFIRPYASTSGDGIPTLCRVQNNPTLSVQPLVEGIEDMDIVYGIDTTGNGVPDAYDANPSSGEMAGVVAAQIYLLVRDVEADPSYTNTNGYALGSRRVGPFNDSFHRAVFSTTVIPFNQRTVVVK